MFSFLQRSTGQALVRPLTTEDWADLDALISHDPVAFLYAAEHLEHFGLPAPSALNSYRAPYGFMGIFVPVKDSDLLANSGVDNDAAATSSSTLMAGLTGRLSPRLKAAAGSFLSPLSQLLVGASESERSEKAVPGETEVFTKSAPYSSRSKMVGAFWLGSNCVPLMIPEEHRRQAAAVIGRSAKTVASIFGEAHEVLPLWDLLEHRMGSPLSVRANQPLLCLPSEHSLSSIVGQDLHRSHLRAPQLNSGGARWARTSDRKSLLKASVAMFSEEVGYDPLSRDPGGYARRIDEFIRTGRSIVATNKDDVVVFKTDLGLAHADTCQIQGVWLHPAYRGMGLSAPLLAQSIQLIRPRFPRISLYVNDYNVRARQLYKSLGMKQRGTFATVLF